MNVSAARRTAAALMSSAAVLAIAGFTVLGSVFEYPQILKEPTADILALYREHQSSVMTWFGVLAVGAVLLAPIGVLLGRLAGGRAGRWIAGVGIAGAVVQAIGLSRWFVFVPGLAADATDPARTAAAHHRFEQLHFWLGEMLGETVGYALTATFVILVARTLATRWTAWLAYLSAALIATGVLIPLGLEMASLTNFAGYVAYSLWLIVFAVVLWRAPVREPAHV